LNRKIANLLHSASNHYATLGLDRGCSEAQIRAAYRVFAKQHHPDLNRGSHEAVARTQAINAAYEILSDPERRKFYDEELAHAEKSIRLRVAKTNRNILQDLLLPLAEFFRGTTREVHLNDAGNPNGREVYELVIPPATAPGTRFRLRREDGGFVIVRVKPFPHFQFKTRGADLRCDLKINSKLAAQGGEQMVKGVLGSMLRVKIPARVARGEIIRIAGEGLPKPRGGRGDLLVRIIYRPEIRITRSRG
jgi:DnaJ-class molecular chaperone